MSVIDCSEEVRNVGFESTCLMVRIQVAKHYGWDYGDGAWCLSSRYCVSGLKLSAI